MNLITRRLAIVVIIAAISIGLLVQFMLWRIEDVEVDWIAAILGLAAMGILVIAGLEFHYCAMSPARRGDFFLISRYNKRLKKELIQKIFFPFNLTSGL